MSDVIIAVIIIIGLLAVIGISITAFLVHDNLYGEDNVQIKNIILTWQIINGVNQNYGTIWNKLKISQTFSDIACGNKYVMQQGYVKNLILIVDELLESPSIDEDFREDVRRVTQEKVYLIDMARKSKHLKWKYER